MDKMVAAEIKTDEAIIASLQTVINTILKRIERRKIGHVTPVMGVDFDNEFPIVEKPIKYACPDCKTEIAYKDGRTWKLFGIPPMESSKPPVRQCKCAGFWEYGHRNGVIHFICVNEHPSHLKYDVAIAEYTRTLGCPA